MSELDFANTSISKWDLPSSCGQQRVDHRGFHARVLELLKEGWLVKGDAGRERFRDNALAFLHKFRGESIVRAITC